MRRKTTFAVAAMAALLALPLVPTAANAQGRLLGVSVGAHYGFEFSNDDIDQERIGVQAVLPVVGLFEFTPAIGYFTNFPDISGFSGNAWQVFLAARVRPPGPASFLSVGYGVTALRVSAEEDATGVSDSDTEWTDVGVIGVEFPGGLLRPFADVYLVDILDRESSVGGVLLVGLNIGI
ncbi:MAG: hypothetical protein ABFS14_03110 [Gemmatimonadota bacterium]